MSAEHTSHAPAAKPDSQHSLWESPDRSVAIYLGFEVIDAINQALTQMAAAPPVRGAEIGGLLLGKSERRERLTVWIDRFEPVPCSYPLGASWTISEDAKDELADRLGEAREPRVAGFFRSHTRKDLFLSEDDMALFSRLFADTANVFLLVKPFTTRPSLGGFFYWEGGSIHGTRSHQEFPFHRHELGGGEPVPVAVPPPDAWVRREEQRAVPGEAGNFPASMFLRENRQGKPRRLSLLGKLGCLLGFVTICLAGYTAYTRYGSHSLPLERALQLSATEGEKSITLTWDRSSRLFTAATRGTVEITEGSFHKIVEMSPGDLRAGRVIYSRPYAIGDTVSFRMRLNTGQGEQLDEGVRFVSREAVTVPLSIPPAPTAAARPQMASSKPRPKRAAVAETNSAEMNTTAVAPPPPPLEAPKVAVPNADAPKIVRPAPRREP